MNHLKPIVKYLNKIKKAVKQTLTPKPKVRYLSSYMEWYNSNGWMSRLSRDGTMAHYHTSK
jgi:hypothetical protein